jgi:predicted ATPase/DNA-binding winged helix-turn-helix (wHTH) protein
MSEGFAFAGYRLVPAQRLLLDGDEPVRLGSRALDLLIALVEKAGEVVPTTTLVERVWPRTVVGDDNLRVHIAALRKRLSHGRGELRFIGNVPLRGYCFVAPVSAAGGVPPVMPDHRVFPGRNRIIGRQDVIESIAARLADKRFVTLVGPGGMGKTTVAAAVAEASSATYQEPPCVVDLALLSDSKLVPAALAAALGLTLASEQPLPGLVAALRDRRMLVVLDNCEHVICAVAALVVGLFSQLPQLHILATSREPLRVPGEWVQRLPALSLPPLAMPPTANEALEYTAVQLLVERAVASQDSFELRDDEAQAAAEICRRLDGIPLAIELAAARINLFGIAGVAARLSDRFALLTRGPRTAVPRHQTLRATMDWSHDCLAVDEQCLLRRLAVFKGPFTIEAAVAVSAVDVMEPLSQLVDKSLVSGADAQHYRLLDSTRAYALEKLASSGEMGATRQRHAAYFLDLTRRPHAQSVELRIHRLDEVRAALDWAIGADGDASLGIALTAAAAGLAIGLSQLTEFRHRVRQAIERLPGTAAEGREDELLLQRSLGDLLLHTEGPGPAMSSAFQRCFDVAQCLGRADSLAMATGGLWVAAMAAGDYAKAAEICKRLADMPLGESEMLGLERMRAQTSCFAGDVQGATAIALRLLKDPDHHAEETSVVHVDRRVSMRIVLARAAWQQGHGAEARAWAEEAVSVASDLDHAIALCYSLAFAACPIACANGQDTALESHLHRLGSISLRYGLGYYQRWSQGYGLLRTQPSEVDRVADPRLRADLVRLRADSLA